MRLVFESLYDDEEKSEDIQDEISENDVSEADAVNADDQLETEINNADTDDVDTVTDEVTEAADEESEAVDEEIAADNNKYHSAASGIGRRKRSYAIAIIIPAVILVILLVGGLIAQKYYPIMNIWNTAENGKKPQNVTGPDDGRYSEWTVMERVNVEGAEGFSLELQNGALLNNILIENHYRDRALLIRFKNISADYFPNAVLKGDISDISVAAWKVKDGEVLLSLQMNGVWEYEVSQTDGKLVVNRMKAHDSYDAVVVIDPVACVGASEDVTALIAESLVQIAADEGIKVYLTRGNGGERSEAERLALIVDVEPDYVLELTAASDSDGSKYGMSAVYNSRYFNPECDNVLVADAILRNAAGTASNRANAIEDSGTESILRLVQIPAAGLTVGYVTNSKEYELLQNENYRIKIAEGILAGFRELLQ